MAEAQSQSRKQRRHPSPEEMLAPERDLWARGFKAVAGIDEVGIGPLAGPVVAAAVILPPRAELEGVRDSKALSRKRREELDAVVREHAVGVGIGVVDAGEVDRINPYQAGLRAMERALRALPSRPDHLLIDARRLPGIETPQTDVVRGDAKIRVIAAASIVAKVHRDTLMMEVDAQYPEYGFARHVGYATALHLEALRRLGPCPAHRRSYAPVRAALGEQQTSGDSL